MIAEHLRNVTVPVALTAERTTHLRSYLAVSLKAGPWADTTVGAPTGFSLLAQRLLYRHAVQSERTKFQEIGAKLGMRATAEEVCCFIACDAADLPTIGAWLSDLLTDWRVAEDDFLLELTALQSQLEATRHEARQEYWNQLVGDFGGPSLAQPCDVPALARMEPDEVGVRLRSVLELGVGVAEFGPETDPLASPVAAPARPLPAFTLSSSHETIEPVPRGIGTGLALLPGRLDEGYLAGLASWAALAYGRQSPSQESFHKSLALEELRIAFHPFVAGSLLELQTSFPGQLAGEVAAILRDLLAGEALGISGAIRERCLRHHLEQVYDSPVDRAVESAARALWGQQSLTDDLRALREDSDPLTTSDFERGAVYGWHALRIR
jgi:hypothetical protein